MTTYLQILDLFNQAKALRQSLSSGGAAALTSNLQVFLMQHPSSHPSVIALINSAITLSTQAQSFLMSGNSQSAQDDVDRIINELVSAVQISDSATFLPLPLSMEDPI